MYKQLVLTSFFLIISSVSAIYQGSRCYSCYPPMDTGIPNVYTCRRNEFHISDVRNTTNECACCIKLQIKYQGAVKTMRGCLKSWAECSDIRRNLKMKIEQQPGAVGYYFSCGKNFCNSGSRWSTNGLVLLASLLSPVLIRL